MRQRIADRLTLAFSLLLLCVLSANVHSQDQNERAIAGAMAALDEFMATFNSRNEPIGTYESLYIVTRDEQGEWGTQARSSLAP